MRVYLREQVENGLIVAHRTGLLPGVKSLLDSIKGRPGNLFGVIAKSFVMTCPFTPEMPIPFFKNMDDEESIALESVLTLTPHDILRCYITLGELKQLGWDLLGIEHARIKAVESGCTEVAVLTRSGLLFIDGGKQIIAKVQCTNLGDEFDVFIGRYNAR